MGHHAFHVHGPHDHELEHAAQHGERDGFAGRIAVTTAVLATLGAVFSYMGGATQANAALLKNDAAIRKTEASNQWAYYQAKSTKQGLAELAMTLVPEDRRAHYRQEMERYDGEKNEIRRKAEGYEKEASEFDARAEGQMHMHHRWAQATTALQVAIALAAIALLTRRAWLHRAMIGVAAVGVVLGVLAGMHI